MTMFWRAFATGCNGARAPWIMAAVFLAQAVVLSLLRSGTSYDGAEQLLYTQYFDLGYGRSQPPLFTWMLMAVQQAFGVSQIAENLLKFALLAAGFAAVWRLARGLGYDCLIATAAMLSLFAIVEIGFEAPRTYSHSVLLFAMTGWIGVLYLALLERESLARYALLGLFVRGGYPDQIQCRNSAAGDGRSRFVDARCGGVPAARKLAGVARRGACGGAPWDLGGGQP